MIKPCFHLGVFSSCLPPTDSNLIFSVCAQAVPFPELNLLFLCNVLTLFHANYAPAIPHDLEVPKHTLHFCILVFA